MKNREALRRSSLRRWLQRVALGLPLVAAPPGALLLLASSACAPCNNGFDERFEIEGADVERVTRGGGVVLDAECRALCSELNRGVFPDGAPRMLDGAVGGGRVPSRCSLEGEGATRTIICSYPSDCGGSGRRPAGLSPLLADADAGSWFARVAHLEAASVSAFEDLATELRLAGAPWSLVERARRAAQDEVEHAQVVTALAAARAALPRGVDRARSPRRALAEMALDNAVEGCVREAYGALAAAHQAEHARDADVRAAFATIARDEARHALLSEDIDAWARASQPELDPILRRARLDALAELEAELAAPISAHERELGLPSREFRLEALAALSLAA